jgi:uroporphyrinogen III methyltransferase / synthase
LIVFPRMDIRKKGVVYLIGAGPGDPDLFTIKGKLLLEDCDVVVYDNLVPDELVVTLPYEKEKHYVGKRAGKPCFSQKEINELLVSLALAGKKVARLKGGDPFVFARGGEEAKYLKEHEIRFEIVPGVTSGIAAPAYCGIPPTDRRLASFVLFVSGHKAKEKELSTVPWEWIAQARGGTIVIYMGVGEIEKIAGKLINSGMAPDTPAAIIERGTFPTQRTVTSSLKLLPQKVIDENIKPPALFIIGQTVNLRPYLQWLENRPLLGVRLMVTRPAEQSREMYRSLRKLGAEVQAYPTVATVRHDHDEAWHALKKVTGRDCWLAFTSGAGIRYFITQFNEQVGDLRALGKFKIAAMGKGTAGILSKYHLKPDFIPSDSSIVGFALELKGLIDSTGSAVVRIRGDKSDSTLEKTLAEGNIEVIPLTVYRTLFTNWPDDLKDKLFELPPDAIIFTSSSTVEGIYHCMTEEEVARLAANAAIVSIGPSTTKRLGSRGLAVTLEPKERTIQALLDLLIEHFKNRNK